METIIQIVAVPILLVFCVLYYIFASRASSIRKIEADQQLSQSDGRDSATKSQEDFKGESEENEEKKI